MYEVSARDWPADATGRESWLAVLAGQGWLLESRAPDPVVVHGQVVERFFFVRGLCPSSRRSPRANS